MVTLFKNVFITFFQSVCVGIAIGIILFFFFFIDARGRGTGDVVNSVKSEKKFWGWTEVEGCLWLPVHVEALLRPPPPHPPQMEAQFHFTLQGDPAAAKNKDMDYFLTAKCLFFFFFRLCHIAVLVRRGLASLDVLLVDKHFDALFYHTDTGVEPGFGLVDHLEERKKTEKCLEG